jgi:diguanylate cyclase
MYWPRIIGLGLGAVMVAGVLHQIGAPMWVWLLLAANSVVWPHAAYFLAKRSANPYIAEHRNLLLDSGSGGFWVVAIGFNLLPSALMLTMFSMSNIAIGGSRLFVRGAVAHLVGALVAWPVLGGHVELASSLSVIFASLPFLVTYPVIIGVISYRLSLQLSQEKRKMELLSQRDTLSGLASRGYWEIRLDDEFRRWERHGRMAALLLVDIDHFKRINDTHGHVFGDQVIRSMGEVLSKQARREDIVGRYGGDEFGLILAECSAENAIRVAQRIQRSLASVSIPGGLDLNLTVSIGVATLSPQISAPLDWLNRADKALYHAKESGRNCIRAFDDDGVIESSND